MKRTTAFVLGGGGILAGLFTANFLIPSFLLIGSVIVVALFVAILGWKQKIAKRVGTFLICVAIGLLYFLLWQHETFANIPFSHTIKTSGEIISCRERFNAHQCQVETHSPFGAKLLFETQTQYIPGDFVEISGTILVLKERQQYLLGDGVVATFSQPQIQKLSHPVSVRGLLHAIREKSEIKLVQALTEPTVSLATGILFGTRQQFDQDFLNALRETNTLHIIAVSGFNITVLAEFIRRSLSAFPRKTVFVVSCLAITLFVGMIGAPPSAVRAAIMGVLLLFGQLIGRKPFIPSLLVLTALSMALPNPYILRYDIGFQLSFLAFMGLVSIAPTIERRLTILPQPIRGLAATTLGATLATAPRLLPLSGSVSLIGPLTNILVLPMVPFLMLGASVVLALSFVSMTVARTVGFLLYLPSMWIMKAIEVTANIPFAQVPWTIGTSIFLLIGLFCVLFRRRNVSTT